MMNEEKNISNEVSLTESETQDQPVVEKTFSSPQEYVDFIRELIRTNTTPQAWLSYDMLSALLESNAVSDYYKEMGYESLEEFLSDPQYRMLWRVDRQENAPFLIRHSYAKEIQEYVDAIAEAIRKLYIENSRTPIALSLLSNHIKNLNLPISALQMGFPSFEVFLLDKRFAHLWSATKTPDFSIVLEPVDNTDERQLFLERTFQVVAKYFAHHTHRPTQQQLVNFFQKGVASKLYSRYGYASLEELASEPIFAPLLAGNGETKFSYADKIGATKKAKGKYDLEAEEELINAIRKGYAHLLDEPKWISLTEIAARIPDIKGLIRRTPYKSLSRFIQANAEKFPLQYSYTEAPCPAFQIRFDEMPDVPKSAAMDPSQDSEEIFVHELEEVVKKLHQHEEWVLLAVLGQHIHLMKERLHTFGYSSIGHFVKQNATKYGWQYRCLDSLPSKFAIKIADVSSASGSPSSVEKARRASSNSDEMQDSAHTKKDVRRPLLEPIYCYSVTISAEILSQIAQMAEPEPWQKGDQKPYTILDYYLRTTLARSIMDATLVKLSDGFLFNTALVTPEGEEILAILKELKNDTGALRLTITEIKLLDDAICEEVGFRPRIPRYFNFSGRVPLEVYICKPSKLLPSYQYETLKGDAKDLFDEKDLLYAVEHSWLRLNRQIRMAINIYTVESNEMHLLLPLYKEVDSEHPVASLELVWRSGYYEALAVHSLPTSYMLARPIAKPVASIIRTDI